MLLGRKEMTRDSFWGDLIHIFTITTIQYLLYHSRFNLIQLIDRYTVNPNSGNDYK